MECSTSYCKRFPLYDAILNFAPDGVILTLLEANQQAANVRDRRGCRCYPLVKAIQLKHSDEIILYLLAAQIVVDKTPCE
ncbi:MAG: hypothetical protein ACK53Y_10750, partial [bacterium]